MALVQLPADVPAFAGSADATFCHGQSLLDMLVRASHPTAITGPLVSRALVPYFGNSEPAVNPSVASKRPSRPSLSMNARTRKSRGEPSSPGRGTPSNRAVKARSSTAKPASKVWASCMTSPNPEDVPLPSQAFLGRARPAST
ncbi:hypothetical protein WJX74_007803 [Apatococcus lobatus]|uniref:Uncharacterized protein n=1 Tax=Apatococcus lobatus TaxID=904363 RepID=A0AAW1RJE5_9CHLO